MFEMLRKKIAELTQKLAKKTIEVQQKTEEEKIAEIKKENIRELKAEISVSTKIKKAFTRELKISANELESFIDEFELAMLEADVEQQTAKDISEMLKKELSEIKIPTDQDINLFLKNELKKILKEIMKVETIDIFSEIEKKNSEKKAPYIILFLGPNGAGKTTTIAKLTAILKKNGKNVIWAASDTFRAASIEQLEKHATNLNVKVVSHQYGADPAAVAFDAIRSAEAKKIDVVMIDSAGRQETNRNLVEELKKIVRVVKPDLKIYVGEAFTGQALLKQAQAMNDAVGIDGFILTKIDCDAKGGTAISVLHKLKKPIVFLGTGQNYEDLEKFDVEFILNRIIS